MPVTSNNASTADLEARRDEILSNVGTTWDDLTDRRAAGILTPEEWEAWDELDGIIYLLSD